MYRILLYTESCFYYPIDRRNENLRRLKHISPSRWKRNKQKHNKHNKQSNTYAIWLYGYGNIPNKLLFTKIYEAKHQQMCFVRSKFWRDYEIVWSKNRICLKNRFRACAKPWYNMRPHTKPYTIVFHHQHYYCVLLLFVCLSLYCTLNRGTILLCCRLLL